jgi:hypothetical protein
VTSYEPVAKPPQVDCATGDEFTTAGMKRERMVVMKATFDKPNFVTVTTYVKIDGECKEQRFLTNTKELYVVPSAFGRDEAGPQVARWYETGRMGLYNPQLERVCFADGSQVNAIRWLN